MKTSYKVAYGAAAAAVVVGGGMALMATRSSAMGDAPATTDVSNLTTLLFGGGTATAIITAIIQAIRYFLQGQFGRVDNSPHQALFSAILAAMDVASGKAAETSGSQTLGGGRLEWSVKFTPTAPVTGGVDPTPVQN